jgi:hypothetical protein
MSSNELIFPGALTGPGGLIADIVIRIGRATFEQDAVLRTKLDVTSYGVSSNALIQVMTELYDPPPQPPAPDIPQLKANRAALRATAAATRASQAAASQAAAGKAAAAPTTAKVWLTTNGGPTYVQVSGSRISPSAAQFQSAAQLATNGAPVLISTQPAAVISTNTTATLSSPVRQAPISANPSRAEATTNSTLPDDPVRFGQLSIARGIAYSTRNVGQTNRPAHVTKQVVTNSDSRVFLLESVKNSEIRTGLMSLPAALPASSAGGAQVAPAASAPTYAATPPTLPRSPLPRSDTSPLLAQAPARPNRVVIDYVAALIIGDIELLTGWEYLAMGRVSCDSLTIQPSTTVKFIPCSENSPASISVRAGGINCYATSASPATFTAVDDDDPILGASIRTYEDALPYYTGAIASDFYANPALHITSESYVPDVTLSHCRFLHARLAVAFDCPSGDQPTLTLTDCLFTNCLRAIELDGGGSSTCVYNDDPPTGGSVGLSLENVLMSSVVIPFDVQVDDVNVNLTVNGSTIHGSSWCILVARRMPCFFTSPTLAAYNVVFANVSPEGMAAYLSGDNNAFYNAPQFGSQTHSLPADHLYAPVLTSLPQSQTAFAGGPASLGVNAIGVGPFSYQWMKYNGGGYVNLACTFSTLYLTSHAPTDAGDYLVRVGNPYPTAYGWANIVARWDAVAIVNQRSFSLGTDPNGYAYIVVSPGGYDAGAQSACSTSVLPLGQWTHVAGTYDGTSLRIYVNGVLENTTTFGPQIFPGTDDVGIGGTVAGLPSGTANYTFNGKIDEVAVYNRALSTQEIQTTCHAGSLGRSPLTMDLRANYRIGAAPVLLAPEAILQNCSACSGAMLTVSLNPGHPSEDAVGILPPFRR